jgi:hypothetical protein
MARSGFNSTNHLTRSGGNMGVTGQALTIFARMFGRGSTSSFVVDASAASNNYRRILVSNSTGQLDVGIDDGNGFIGQASGTVPNTAAWHSVCAVYTSSTSRVGYVNGVAGTVNTVARSPSAPDQFHIGVNRALNGAASNAIAEVCYWNVALTAQQVADLHAGADPRTIAGANLVAYIPMCEGAAAGVDQSGLGNTFTEVGTLALAADVPGITSACTVAPGLQPGVATLGAVAYNSVAASATNATAGTAPYSYQWQRRLRDGGETWASVAGQTTLSMTDTTVAASTNYDYRLRYTDSAGTPAIVYSNVLQANVPASPTGTITGVVRHLEDNTTEAGAVVLAIRQSNNTVAGTATSNGTGVYSITGLTAGQYDVYARAIGTYRTVVHIGIVVT